MVGLVRFVRFAIPVWMGTKQELSRMQGQDGG